MLWVLIWGLLYESTYYGKLFSVSNLAEADVVSFAAVIRVVTRHATLLPTSGEERCVTSDDPNNGCEGD